MLENASVTDTETVHPGFDIHRCMTALLTDISTKHEQLLHLKKHTLQAVITDMHGQNRYLDARTCAGLTPLHMAAWAGHVEVAKILLANGAFLNPKIVFSSPSTSSVLPGSTPTHLATRKNRIHVVKALLTAYVCLCPHHLDIAIAVLPVCIDHAQLSLNLSCLYPAGSLRFKTLVSDHQRYCEDGTG